MIQVPVPAVRLTILHLRLIVLLMTKLLVVLTKLLESCWVIAWFWL